MSKILYVEDNEANALLLAGIVESHTDYEIDLAPMPEDGLQMAKDNDYSLFVLDINMPEMNGYEVLAHLKQHARTANVPTIALTANATVDDISRGLQAGFDDYVTKPYTVEYMIGVLDKYLKPVVE